MLEALDIKTILLSIERTVRQLDAAEEPVGATDGPATQPAAQPSEDNSHSNVASVAQTRGNRAA